MRHCVYSLICTTYCLVVNFHLYQIRIHLILSHLLQNLWRVRTPLDPNWCCSWHGNLRTCSKSAPHCSIPDLPCQSYTWRKPWLYLRPLQRGTPLLAAFAPSWPLESSAVLCCSSQRHPVQLSCCWDLLVLPSSWGFRGIILLIMWIIGKRSWSFFCFWIF